MLPLPLLDGIELTLSIRYALTIASEKNGNYEIIHLQSYLTLSWANSHKSIVGHGIPAIRTDCDSYTYDVYTHVAPLLWPKCCGSSERTLKRKRTPKLIDVKSGAVRSSNKLRGALSSLTTFRHTWPTDIYTIVLRSVTRGQIRIMQEWYWSSPVCLYQ